VLVWKRIVWLRLRIARQKEWIDRHGGDLAGYVARYGDPGRHPLGPDGLPRAITVAAGDRALLPDLERVPGTEDRFYAAHFGDGGTAIYQADSNQLSVLQRELSDLEVHCHGAKIKADEFMAKNITNIPKEFFL
jgi:hypothetical protein